MLIVRINDNFAQVSAVVGDQAKGARSVVREALNRTIDAAHVAVRAEMRKVFDRPTPYTMGGLFRRYASTANLQGLLWFKQRSREDDDRWAVPQIHGGERALKPLELRMQRAGMLPRGWFVVPGEAAPLDAFGNMSRGEISRILNVLGTYRESGFNKADARTRDRLARGNAKKGVYGFAYWVNPVSGPGHQKHLPPGVYRRVSTGFGSSLKPMLIFVTRARYRQRLDFFGVVQRTINQRAPQELDKALRSFVQRGSASAARISRRGEQAFNRTGGQWRYGR